MTRSSLAYSLAGEIDADVAPQHLERLVALIEGAGPDHAEIEVDLSDTRMVDTTGLGMLITAQKAARAAHKTLVLRGANHRIVRLMQIAGTHDVFVWRD